MKYLPLVLLLAPAVAAAESEPDASAETETQPDPAPAPTPDAPPEAAPPPAPVATGVRGRVVDARTGAPLPDITVEVVGGPTVVTDEQGRFELDLASGTYTLRVGGDFYERRRVRGVVVRRGLSRLTIKLTEEEVEVFVVEGTIEKKTEAGQLAARKKATTVSDVISAQEISRTPDASAGDAIKRVPSVTLVDGKYVVLRGLEGRYVTTMLNGVILPSPEPDRNAVPLDLFPTSLLSNLTVIKSYGVEFPGQFGGGTLLIETNSYPDKLEIKASASTSMNTTTTFQDGLANRTGGNVFGYDDGTRELPGGIPRDRALTRDNPDLEAIGESMLNVWTPDGEQVNPNFSVGMTVGDDAEIAGRDVGYLLSTTLRRSFGGKQGASGKVRYLTGDELVLEDVFDYRTGEIEATVGALGNVGFELAKGHEIDVFGLYTHVGEDLTSQASGFSTSDSSVVEQSHVEFVERALTFGQVQGRHDLGAPDLTWQVNAATTSRDELDTRDISYRLDEQGNRYWRDQPGSGQHYFAGLADASYGLGADLTVPSEPTVLRVGGSVQRSSRDFDGRRFRFRYIGDDAMVRSLPPEEMLSADHIGPDFRLEEQTLQEDAYTADLDVLGAYALAEVQASERAKAILGMRFEHAGQRLANGSPTAVSGTVGEVDRSDDDLLPAGNVVYALTPKQNLRLAYSYTLVRPRFRELSPILYFDYVRRRNVSGNIDLVTTHIHNADLRWEWFAGERDVFAVSAFWKGFQDPIEQTMLTPNQDVWFKNAEGGTLVGIELEARTGLGRFTELLDRFRVSGNVALMRSRVELGEEPLLTSQERPLYGQSPYVVNVAFEYANPRVADVNLLYNVLGPRISDVGVMGIPDIYERPSHRVDLVAARQLGEDLKLKLSVSNLLNQSVELEVGEFTVNRYDPGTSISVGLDWTP